MFTTEENPLAIKINLIKKKETQDAVIYKEIYEFFSCIRIKRKH